MEINRREAIISLAALAANVSAADTKSAAVIIKGVDRYRVCEPMYEGIRVILASRGEKYSPAYIQGISGAAFRIAGPCPCAPTCAGAIPFDEFIRLLGYENETILSPKKNEDEKKWLAATLLRIHDEVKAGRPVLVFHAFTSAEWDVVCGFDLDKKQLIGRGSYKGDGKDYAREDEARMLTAKEICDIIGPTLIGKKTGSFDAHTAEMNALKEAVRYARSTAQKYPYPGIQCYNLWIDQWSKPEPRKPDWLSDGYTSGVYRSTQKAAADFLREIKPRLPEASSKLELAAKQFAIVAKALDDFHVLLFPKTNAKITPNEATLREQSKKALTLLSTARNAYNKGIDGIEEAIKA